MEVTRESAALMQVEFLEKASLRADDASNTKAEASRLLHTCLCAHQQSMSIPIPQMRSQL